jgi:hypothetical protein
MWAWHAARNEWESLTPNGGTFSSDCMKAAYDPAENVFYVNGFAYRYKKGTVGVSKKLPSSKPFKSMIIAEPNPFNPVVRIRLNDIGYTGVLSYSIFSQDGKCVFKRVCHEAIEWNATNMSSGIYVVHVSKNGKNFSAKISLMR